MDKINEVVLLAILGIAVSVQAQIFGKLDTKFFSTGNRRVAIFSEKGEVLWEHPAKGIHDAWLLPNGNVLFADGDVHEVTPDHKEIFTYHPPVGRGDGAYSCQRLENGNTLVGENASGRIVEVDPKGKVVVSFMTKFDPKVPPHHHMRYVRKLKNGNYLVGQSKSNFVREYAPDGKVVWEVATKKGLAFAGIRLENGNTLVSTLHDITEYSPDKKIVWEFNKKDIPGVHLQNLTGMHVLPNGNIVIGCYSAYNREGEGNSIIEITREKKMVWRFVNKRDRHMMGVTKLIPGLVHPVR